MKNRSFFLSCLAAVVTLTIAASVHAQAPKPTKKGLETAYPPRPYSPYADRDFPMNVYWGDTHVHTGLSFDAGSFGARLLPADAYEFAKGEQVTSSTGQRVKLSRPLDFLVVSDHSDNMGFFPKLLAGDPEFLANETGRRWYDMIQAGEGVDVALEVIGSFSDGTFPQELWISPGESAYRATWDEIIEAAETANDPGHFTAFIGYEWTSNTKGANLHRVVIYRDGGDRAGQMEPYTTIRPLGSDDPKDLWKWLTKYQEKSGGQVLAIPHNGNLSNGIMFPLVDSFGGQAIDRAYAESRDRWEPLAEVTQIKGDGETHQLLSPDDEFADYETWDKANLDLTIPKEDWMLEFEYARSALKNGLLLENKIGVNPYKFGMIGSTDSHTALATADEDNWFGKHAGTEPNKDRIDHPMGSFGDMEYEGWSQVASGYAGIWAKENTREAIFDAMMRKEVYATTGPRMIVRFFGGWEFTDEDGNSRSPALAGYRKGVPMGGDLHNAPSGKSPSFLVAALKDPLGANLDRIQIVKGWLDSDGKLHEKVYNVAVSDGRKPDRNGRVKPVGSTVDVKKASWTNTIGDTELITVWKDPDFDSKDRAFYYARVIEIPKPRWTAYDAKYYGLKVGKDIPMVTQDRAYTSPIWYTPGS